MDGNRAYEELSRMTAEEREGVRMIWLDEEEAENFYGDDYEEKVKFFTGLSPKERGELIEKALYSKNGDFKQPMLDWLEDFEQSLEILVQKKMREEDLDEEG